VLGWFELDWLLPGNAGFADCGEPGFAVPRPRAAKGPAPTPRTTAASGPAEIGFSATATAAFDSAGGGATVVAVGVSTGAEFGEEGWDDAESLV